MIGARHKADKRIVDVGMACRLRFNMTFVSSDHILVRYHYDTNHA
jgi:hypothetical protein